ncbi:hypothetical protein ZWY2020_045025 [Hordeum vulgare]|nr:hypothetical protein ZWY2020_045025 [Hordeum vulgare]
MPSHPKGWGESWFYCQETSPSGENKLLGYRKDRLPTNFKLPDKLTEEEESDFIPVFSELRSVTNNGLTELDLIRCWVEWRILPLSRRDGLMCEFDGTLDHPQCYFHTALTEKDIVTIIKKLTSEPAGKYGQIGLKPFFKINPAPKKGDKFWSKKPKKPAMKQAKPPPKKTKGKGKAAAAEPSEVDESQVGDALSEETLAQTESTLGDLKKNLSGQQDVRAKSEEKHQLVMAELEKLKADLKRAQADQDTATKRAEKAEARLATVQQELSGLKRHISNMTQAVFGPRAANLQDDCVLMLKAIYTLTEQLYTGSVLTVKAVMGAKEPITSIKKMLGCLSTLPPQIGELTRKNKKVSPPTFVTTSLTPRRPKNPFDLEADLALIPTDEDDFAALAKCNWVLGDLQIEVGQSSQQNDLKAPTE